LSGEALAPVCGDVVPLATSAKYSIPVAKLAHFP
jgi:hypothetical protein